MLDILLIGEWLWCSLLFVGARIEKTLILAGGVLAAGYTASVVAPWMTQTFLPPSSAVFRWTMANISENTIPVNTIGKYIPPEAAAAPVDHSHWITIHILLSFMFVAVTLTVFTLFIVINLLRETLWDLPVHPWTPWKRCVAFTFRMAASAYIIVVTAVLIGNLAWIHTLGWLQQQANHSMLMGWIGALVSRWV